jgi:hypothetical protein
MVERDRLLRLATDRPFLDRAVRVERRADVPSHAEGHVARAWAVPCGCRRSPTSSGCTRWMRPGTRVTGIRSTRTTTRAASSSTGRAANAPHARRSGSSRRVRAVLRSVPRQQGQASQRHPVRRWRVHGLSRTVHRDVHRPARAARRDGHRTNRQVVRGRLLNDRSLAGRQDRRGVPQVRQRQLHAADRPRLGTFVTRRTAARECG